MYPERVLHWIDDGEAASSSAATFEKRCPIDDRVLTHVTRGNCRRTSPGPSTRRRRRPTPGVVCRRLAAARFLAALPRCFDERQEEFTDIIAAETGKPLKNASAEIGSSADLAVFMEGEGSRFYGKTMTSPILEPWRANAPGADRRLRRDHAVQQSARAAWRGRSFRRLLCGNAVVAKSHEQTPYTAVAVRPAAAGCGPARRSVQRGAGSRARSRRRADAGSARRPGQLHRIGRRPAKPFSRWSATRPVLAKVCLELGGKNPLVVCDDADLTLAAEHAVASAFIDAGQRCASGSRLIVVRCRLRAVQGRVARTRRSREGGFRSG